MVFEYLDEAIRFSIGYLKTYGEEIDTGHWQGVPTESKPDLVTVEATNIVWSAQMPEDAFRAQVQTDCNMPWAEDHFQERVSRVPSNPGEQYKNWPWWNPTKFEVTADSVGFSNPSNEATTIYPGIHKTAASRDFKFTHTYQERFWPKHAGVYSEPMRAAGLRYHYGDLDDVLYLLDKHPHTRQATLPIFFPEDTGAGHGGRIPCTLHYHFLLRNNQLHLWYAIRSCDAVRHFRDDIYMATRLCQWVLDELRGQMEPPLELNNYDWRDVKPGLLHFTAYSFHVHKGDEHLL